MPSIGHRLSVVVLVLAIVGSGLLVTVPATDARAPPTPLCGVCSEDLDESAERHGVDLARGQTWLGIQVYENGSTMWRATVELTTGADALENETRREAVVDSAVGGGVGRPTDVRSRLDGDILVVTYNDPTATSRSFGVLVFTHVVPDGPGVPGVIGGEGPRYLGADHVGLLVPPNYRVTGEYEYARASEFSVSWSSDEDDRQFLSGENPPTMLHKDAEFREVRTTLARWLV